MTDQIIARHGQGPPPVIAETGNRISKPLPACDTNDPAQLESWFGPFGFADHYRKVVLANCREIIRATMTIKGGKVTESRLDDLAHTHPNYLQFLTDALDGRRIRETMIRQPMGL